MNVQERLARLPGNQRITYLPHMIRGYGPYYYAHWTKDGRVHNRYLGKDTEDGLLASLRARQRRYYWRSKPCGHETIHLNCEVCIRAVTWQMRAHEKGA